MGRNSGCTQLLPLVRGHICPPASSQNTSSCATGAQQSRGEIFLPGAVSQQFWASSGHGWAVLTPPLPGSSPRVAAGAGTAQGSLQKGKETLTSHIQKLGKRFHWHEFLLEGFQGLVCSLVDWHVVVSDELGQREGPASLCVTGRHLLRGDNDTKSGQKIII